jgi:hypothetical protein
MNLKHSFSLLGTTAALLALSIGVGAQAEFTNNVKFDSGQDVQPVFEGWNRTPDGTFDLYFGYLNRNWVQQLQVPVGPANTIQPGGPDRGQPTFFYTRTNRKVFTVNVPADFAKKELIWTLTVNGKTRTAYGHLRPDWEITPDGGASGTRTTQEARANRPPTLTLAPVAPARVGIATALSASVADDGLPVPRGRIKPAVGQETPSTLVGDHKDLPTNLPWLRGSEERSGGGGTPADGLSVRWMVFRGPASATFEPAVAKPSDGKTATTAAFAVPGEYTLRAAAHDGLITTYRDVTVLVTK